MLEFNLYAVRDIMTGKLINNLTNPRRKFWQRKGDCWAAIQRSPSYRRPHLELVTLKVIEEVNNE